MFQVTVEALGEGPLGGEVSRDQLGALVINVRLEGLGSGPGGGGGEGGNLKKGKLRSVIVSRVTTKTEGSTQHSQQLFLKYRHDAALSFAVAVPTNAYAVLFYLYASQKSQNKNATRCVISKSFFHKSRKTSGRD